MHGTGFLIEKHILREILKKKKRKEKS
jgi:hypothetical protein